MVFFQDGVGGGGGGCFNFIFKYTLRAGGGFTRTHHLSLDEFRNFLYGPRTNVSLSVENVREQPALPWVAVTVYGAEENNRKPLSSIRCSNTRPSIRSIFTINNSIEYKIENRLTTTPRNVV